MKRYLLAAPFLVLAPKAALAHCPLCTAGAGALAILAASLGVSSVVVGVLIGAFALALGLWISNAIKRQYIPYQKYIFAVLVFAGTVVPIMPLVRHYGPFYVPFVGEYGTTYTINLYVLGVAIGALLMLITPFISRLITRQRGRHVPFQSLLLTLISLVAVSLAIQFLP